MKKYISGIVLFTLLIFGFALVPQAEAQQCATFNFFTNTFHVPCFNLDNQSFWLDMGLARSSPAAMVMTNFGVNNPAISDPDCASFDFSTFIFHIPCSYVYGGNYWIDLLLSPDVSTSLDFTIQGYGVNVDNPAPGY